MSKLCIFEKKSNNNKDKIQIKALQLAKNIDLLTTFIDLRRG